jgi:thiol-disulfide isomerase/thioredoxin
MRIDHLVAVGIVALAGCGAAQDPIKPTESGKGNGGGQCDSTQYPCGPFGYAVGSIVENLQLVGQHDDNSNNTPTDDAIRPIKLADYYRNKGVKVLAVLVAAEWCPPCKVEQPELVKSWNSYKANNAGVEYFEAIIQKNDGTPADMTTVDRWATTYKLPFDVGADPTVALGPYYNIAAFPMQMVIQTSDMSIQWLNNGYGMGALEGAIDPLIGN